MDTTCFEKVISLMRTRAKLREQLSLALEPSYVEVKIILNGHDLQDYPLKNKMRGSLISHLEEALKENSKLLAEYKVTDTDLPVKAMAPLEETTHD